MISFAQRSTGDTVVCLADGAVTVVQSIPAPSGTCNLLSVLGESRAKMSLVEVPKNDSQTVRVAVLHLRELSC